MNNTPLTVISTVNADGKPEAAVIGFGQTKNLENVLGTSNTSRKYANIQRDPHIALAIGWEGGKTIRKCGIVVSRRRMISRSSYS